MSSGLVIFAFHDVQEVPTEFQMKYGLSVTPKVFEEQIDWIQNHFRIISPKSLLDPSSNLENAALITFDDGYAGTFNNALPILSQKNCDALIFLNMGHLEKESPLLSALISWLDLNSFKFRQFCNDNELSHPYHLSMTPALLNLFEREHGLPKPAIIEAYSGSLATQEMLENWVSPHVYYGNHLYEHWNYSALTEVEFCEQYMINRDSLLQYPNYLDLFAFTNGIHPDFSDESIVLKFKEMGMKRAFFSNLGIKS
jgi:peptidoglycan/xylan/chitin deacetylase (PgdA/CDA1 family)